MLTKATTMEVRGIRALTVCVIVMGSIAGCGSETKEDAGAQASSEAAAPSGTPTKDEAGVDCPAFLTTAQVTGAAGLPMRINLAAKTELGTVCQWNAVDDSSITASFRTYEGEDVAIFESESGRAAAVAGFGDAAFQRPASGLSPAGTLYVQKGDLRFEIDAWDTNQTGRLNVDATRIALARIVLGDVTGTQLP